MHYPLDHGYSGHPWLILAVSLFEAEGVSCVEVHDPLFTKGSPLGDTLSLSCEASVGTSGSNN